MIEKFNFDNIEQLKNKASTLNVNLPVSDKASETLKQSLTINGKTITNRLVSQPIEGFDANSDGSPSTRSIDRYVEIVKGGFRFLWLESVSVDHQGRSNPYQLWITEDNVGKFKEMVDTIRKATDEEVYIVIQLTHSGRNSNPDGTPAPVCAFSNPLIPKDNEYIISDDELFEIERDYAVASRLAKEAGFDAVDVRTCHGYLLNEFLAAYNREGRYGGSFENRTRFLMETIDEIRKETDIDLAIRLNMFDGLPYPYGFGVVEGNGEIKEDSTEAFKLLELLKEKNIGIFNITAGIGAYSPFVIRPYDSGGKQPWEDQLIGINRMLANAAKAKEIVGDKIVIASAFSWLREFGPMVAAGGIENNWYDLAGFGRQVIAYPDMANDLFTNGYINRETCCKGCCGCTNLIKRDGKMLKCIFRKKKKMYRLGLIAKDIVNSVSPTIYTTLMKSVGEEATYEIKNVEEDKLAETVEYARTNWHGFNVTMPYKQTILKYMDELDQSAIKCGSTNTVLVKDGKLVAYNTDGFGLIKALNKDGFDFKDKKIVMVGAGGVAWSIAYNLLINEVKEVRIINLYMDQAEALCANFGEKFTAHPLDYDVLNENCKDADLFINASVMGQVGYDDYQQFDFLDKLKENAFVFDVNYSNADAKLLKEANARNLKSYIGSYMTANQAVRVMEIWSGKIPSNEAIDELMEVLVKRGK